MLDVNNFWETIFTKLNVLEQIKKDGYFVLSRSDCSMVFENKFNLRIEQFFIFDSKNDLPKIFNENKLVIIQKYKSTFSICHADNYIGLPDISYIPTSHGRTISVLSRNTFNNNNISFGLAFFNLGIFEDILTSYDGTKLYMKEIYQYNSELSDSSSFKVLYNYKRLPSPGLMRISFVKLIYDFILEDSNSMYFFFVRNISIESFNKSLLYNIIQTFRKLTKKEIIFVLLLKDTKTVKIFEMKFKDIEDIESISLINERIFNYNLEVKQKDNVRTEIPIRNSVSKNSDYIPFPQANDFEKIIKYCDLIFENKKQLQEQVNELGITTRQIFYYRDSCLFIEVIREKDNDLFLDADLYEIYREGTVKDKYEFFINAILENKNLYDCYELYGKDRLDIYTFENVVGNEYKMSESTLKRRLSTVVSWFRWISSTKDIIESTDKNYDIQNGIQKVIEQIINENNVNYIRMFDLKVKLETLYGIKYENNDIIKIVNKSTLFYSDDLDIVFHTKEDFYKYLK